ERRSLVLRHDAQACLPRYFGLRCQRADRRDGTVGEREHGELLTTGLDSAIRPTHSWRSPTSRPRLLAVDVGAAKSRSRGPALSARLAVVDRQPGIWRHLDHDLLVPLAAFRDPRHVLLSALLAEVPAGHGALVGVAGRTRHRRRPGRRHILVRPRLVLR